MALKIYYSKHIMAHDIYELADTAHCAGDLDTALLYYKQVVQNDPTHYDAWRWMGDIYLEQADWQSAIKVFSKACTLCDNDANMCNDFALCCYENDDYEQAVIYYKQALYHNPDLQVAHRNLGLALYELYRTNRPLAIKNAHWWRQNFPNNPQAMVMSSAILGENKAKQNPDFVQGVFDDFAEDFEQKLQDLNYKAPEYIYQKIQSLSPLKLVLDAGCGTGLVGDKIRPLTDTLVGIDLSAEMLKIAEKREIYDTLHQVDLVAFLHDNKISYSAIVAGDVLCYFGDLTQIIQLFYHSLSQQGYLIFTVEYDKNQPFFLTPSGRYTHDENTTKQILQNTGFTNIITEHKILRTEHSVNVQGLVVVAQK